MKKYRSFSKGNSMNGSSITSAGRKKKKDTNEETFTQASLYVTAYFLCYIFATIAQFQDEVGFVMMLLKGIFYPSQGKDEWLTRWKGMKLACVMILIALFFYSQRFLELSCIW